MPVILDLVSRPARWRSDDGYQPMLLAGDGDHHLVEVPLITGTGQPAADLVGERLAELERPLPYGLVADEDAAGGEHLLDHAQAERETEVEPDRVADDLRREAMAGVAGAEGHGHPARLPVPVCHRKPALGNLTVPDRRRLRHLR